MISPIFVDLSLSEAIELAAVFMVSADMIHLFGRPVHHLRAGIRLLDRLL